MRQSDWDSYDDFEIAWHRSFKLENSRWRESELYLNGQFDELACLAWDELPD